MIAPIRAEPGLAFHVVEEQRLERSERILRCRPRLARDRGGKGEDSGGAGCNISCARDA